MLRAIAVPLALFLGVAMAPAVAATADPLITDLEHRLADGGPDPVNAHLQARWSSAMEPLNRRTANCELSAVSLSIRLGRGSISKASQAHVEALRMANGRCPRFVLALAMSDEIPKYCASLDAWSPVQTARELRRRIAAIDTDDLLRTTEPGKACRAAYLYELNNTRVVLKKRA